MGLRIATLAVVMLGGALAAQSQSSNNLALKVETPKTVNAAFILHTPNAKTKLTVQDVKDAVIPTLQTSGIEVKDVSANPAQESDRGYLIVAVDVLDGPVVAAHVSYVRTASVAVPDTASPVTAPSPVFAEYGFSTKPARKSLVDGAKDALTKPLADFVSAYLKVNL